MVVCHESCGNFRMVLYYVLGGEELTEEFKFMSINNEPYKSEGTFYKSGSELTIEFESTSYIRRFKSLMKERVKIESISFFCDNEREMQYAGDFLISRIMNNEVLLIKA